MASAIRLELAAGDEHFLAPDSHVASAAYRSGRCCGTSLAEQQVKLLSRFTKRVVVNYDPDIAGQSATERSLGLLLEQDFEVRVLTLQPVRR